MQKVPICQIQYKANSWMLFIHGVKIMQNKMSVMLSQRTYLVFTVKEEVNLIRGKKQIMTYRKHCFIIVKTQRNWGFFFMDTIHSGLGIKLGTELLSLNNNSKTALRNRFVEVKYVIIDYLSNVSGSKKHIPWSLKINSLVFQLSLCLKFFLCLNNYLLSEENLYFHYYLVRVVWKTY